ncbi:MAG: 3-oxoacyl-[acyl-carrier-protein] reductase [Candidatus Margulisiibacteriota bacterium]|jgi:3-oxoacyl-[acyl-carrier protein] reductase
MNIDLSNKVALVTGSRRGIGKGIAEKLAVANAKIVITSTSEEGSIEVAEEISQKYQVETFGIKADVTNFLEVENLVNRVIEKFGRIDILVNNAGITKDNLMLRMTPEEWLTVINTDLNSVFYFTKLVSKFMLKQKYGRIINISSVIGQMGNAGQSNYAAAKSGILGFTKSVAKEYGKKGLTCNAIAPGFIETDMTGSLPKEYIDKLISALAVQRLGSTEDVANLVLFLASDLAAYITGQVINVDGGMVM